MTKKGIAIIGIITTLIILSISFGVDMYLSRLDSEAKERLLEASTPYDDLFYTHPDDLTEEQIEELKRISMTDATDDESIELAKRANNALYKTMTDEEAQEYASKWVDKHTWTEEDFAANTTIVDVDEHPPVEEASGDESIDYTKIRPVIANVNGMYINAYTDIEVSEQELREKWGFTDAELAAAPNAIADVVFPDSPITSDSTNTESDAEVEETEESDAEVEETE